MIPLMKMEIERHGWLSLQEFADLVAVSQMTPGPIGINAATFIGIRTAGISGAIVSTLGVVLPSFVIIIIIARLLNAFRTNRIVDAVIKGVRPATIGLIATAVLFLPSFPSSVVTSALKQLEHGLPVRGAKAQFCPQSRRMYHFCAHFDSCAPFQASSHFGSDPFGDSGYFLMG